MSDVIKLITPQLMKKSQYLFHFELLAKMKIKNLKSFTETCTNRNLKIIIISTFGL